MARRARRRNPKSFRWTTVGGFLLGFLGPGALGALTRPSQRATTRAACEDLSAQVTRHARLLALGEAGIVVGAWQAKKRSKSESTRALLTGIEWGAGIASVLSALGAPAAGAYAQASCSANVPPEVPGPAPPLAGRRFLGDPLEVHAGRRYRARIELSAPVSWVADRAKVKSYAEGLGFTNVVVWTGEDRVPRDWPLEVLRGENDANVYFVEGVATRDFTRPRPTQVVFAWEELMMVP